MGTTIVFAGGPVPTPADRAVLVARLASLPRGRIVAADSGLHTADALGVELVASRDVVVGDMDSVDPGRLARAGVEGVAVERFPADKDVTDLELALDDAAANAVPGDRIVVVGTTAGRFDHVLAILSTLASARLEGFVRTAWLGVDVVHVVAAGVGSPRRLDLGVGSTFSLLALGTAALGVTVTGARWELHDETLDVGVGRGVSNRTNAEVVTVGCTGGALLVVVPGATAEGAR